MIKRYCDRCGQQIDEGVHAWYVLELHGTDGEFRHKELCEECYEYLCEKDEAPKADRKTENSSEIPNNCEHITEDGVTCAKHPACDDCLDNPLNKVKGSERLVKGSEQTEPTISKMEQVDKDINVRSKTEPQTNADQHTQRIESVKSVEDNGDIIVRSNLEPFRVTERESE